MSKKILHFFLCLLLISCRHDKLPFNSGPVLNDQETVITSITGIIVNENNIPVQGAAVECGTNNTTTDMYGVFRFRKILVSKYHGLVKIIKNGYFNGNRSFIAIGGSTQNLRIKLVPKRNIGNFDAITGGIIMLASGAKVTFPANAIKDVNGNAFSGMVNVAMVYSNPTSSDLGTTIQGDLRGIGIDGNEKVLATYGMLDVELTGSAGQVLNIAVGKTATINIPIPASLLAAAPATIPLWHFEETKGKWIEEGSAIKNGMEYTGNVAHFSPWNYDVAFIGITLNIHLTNNANQSLNNNVLRIRSAATNTITGFARTDQNGNAVIGCPVNQPLILEVLDICGNVIYTQNIGPYSSSSSLNAIVNMPPANYFTVTGTVVDCNNQTVTNGSVFIYTNNSNYYYADITNGNFSIPVLNCSATPLNFSLFGSDFSTQQQSNVIYSVGTSGIVNVNPIQACGNNLNEYFNVIIDGIAVSYYNNQAHMDTIYSSSVTPAAGWTNSSNLVALILAGAFDWSILKINYNGIGSAMVSSGNVSFSSQLGGRSNTIVNSGNSIINELGPVNAGFISGNFNEIVFNFGGTYRTMSGNFRLRRK